MNDLTRKSFFYSVSQDRHAVVRAEPVVDTIQNYQLISGVQNGTHTVVRFQRGLEICSDEDNLITVMYDKKPMLLGKGCKE